MDIFKLYFFLSFFPLPSTNITYPSTKWLSECGRDWHLAHVFVHLSLAALSLTMVNFFSGSCTGGVDLTTSLSSVSRDPTSFPDLVFHEARHLFNFAVTFFSRCRVCIYHPSVARSIDLIPDSFLCSSSNGIADFFLCSFLGWFQTWVQLHFIVTSYSYIGFAKLQLQLLFKAMQLFTVTVTH